MALELSLEHHEAYESGISLVINARKDWKIGNSKSM